MFIGWCGLGNLQLILGRIDAEDRQRATDRIAKHRADNPLDRGGNFRYLEGTINNQTVDNKLWRSTSLDKAIEETHIFTSTEATGSKGETWNRMTDSEYRMLNHLAHQLGAKKVVFTPM